MPGTALPANAALTRHVIVDALKDHLPATSVCRGLFFATQKIMVA